MSFPHPPSASPPPPCSRLPLNALSGCTGGHAANAGGRACTPPPRVRQGSGGGRRAPPPRAAGQQQHPRAARLQCASCDAAPPRGASRLSWHSRKSCTCLGACFGYIINKGLYNRSKCTQWQFRAFVTRATLRARARAAAAWRCCRRWPCPPCRRTPRSRLRREARGRAPHGHCGRGGGRRWGGAAQRGGRATAARGGC